MSLHPVRTGALGALVSTLEQFRADRAERGEAERAADATEAIRQLTAGGAAHFERVYYVVGADADRYTVDSRPRARLEAELAEAAAGWEHQGRTDLAQQARDGLIRVRQGADVVRVGAIVYDVRD